jgi:multiple sugar transport system permease protein
MPRLGKFMWFALPGAFIVVLFVYAPVLGAVGLSFLHLESMISTPHWAGVGNFVASIEDPAFWNAFQNGLIYAVASVVVQLLVGVAFALVLRESFPGVAALRGLAVLPYVAPAVVAVLIWRWMLNGSEGVISGALADIGLKIPFFSDTTWAMISVVLISVWTWTPFVTIVVLAALQSVPADLENAARTDGANAWRVLWHVILPSIAPVLIVVVLLRGIWMFNKFDVIYLATGGGPLHSTEHLPVLSYKLAFEQFNIGQGASVAVLNFVFLVVIVLIYLRFTRRWSND